MRHQPACYRLLQAVREQDDTVTVWQKFYRQDLINNLFMHPYTRIEFVERDLQVSRLTAAKRLDALMASGFARKVKVGRSNCYINQVPNAILTRAEMVEGAQG